MMHHAVRALRAEGYRRASDLPVAGAPHGVRDRAVRPLPDRARSSCCKDGPVFQYRRGQALGSEPAAYEEASPRRLQVRLVRRLPAAAPQRRGRAAGLAGAGASSPTFPRPAAASLEARTTSPWSRAASPLPTTPSASSACAPTAAILITIGACATAGGIQALRNWADVEEYKRVVYPSPEFISTLSTSTPISEHVRVDYELWGCPIDLQQLLTVVRSLLSKAQPVLPAHSVCMECKRRGNVCVVVARGEPVPGARDAHGMRRAMPDVQSRMLRLLRTCRRPEHGIVHAIAG